MFHLFYLLINISSLYNFLFFTEQKLELSLRSENHVEKFIPANSIVSSYAGSWKIDDLTNKNAVES
jgi:hypothetical protein